MVVGVLWFGHVWLPQALAHLSLLMMYLLIAVAELILKYTETSHLLKF
uniref:Uncharacterized protein n=1 Tax=Anguilla anguilla TaxID=7936 RepID=A0A0E9U631_ANGAN